MDFLPGRSRGLGQFLGERVSRFALPRYACVWVLACEPTQGTGLAQPGPHQQNSLTLGGHTGHGLNPPLPDPEDAGTPGTPRTQLFPGGREHARRRSHFLLPRPEGACEAGLPSPQTPAEAGGPAVRPRARSAPASFTAASLLSSRLSKLFGE